MSLVNTDTAERLDVQFNPEGLKSKLAAVFTEPEVLGASAQEQQFKNAKNFTIDFDLRFDALVSRSWPATRIEDAKRFLWALAQPRAGDRVGTIDPPKVLFVWPKLYTIVGRINEPAFDELRFARTGPCTLLIAHLQVKQVLTARRTSERVRGYGMNGADGDNGTGADSKQWRSWQGG
jgi:hypothetical protein